MDEASSQGTRFCVAEHDLQIVPPHPSDPIMWRPQRRPRREAGAPRDGMQSLCGRTRRPLLPASRSAEPKISDALEKSVTAGSLVEPRIGRIGKPRRLLARRLDRRKADREQDIAGARITAAKRLSRSLSSSRCKAIRSRPLRSPLGFTSPAWERTGNHTINSRIRVTGS